MTTTDFAVLILTHGRPDNVMTHHTLRHCGYTGPIYLVVDDEDPTADEYRSRFGAEWVIQFDKAEVAKRVDTADLSTDRRAILFARHAAFDIARSLGLRHFVQLDDDYPHFSYRRRPLPDTTIRNLDGVFAALVKLLEDTGALTVAMAQGGDYMGGSDNEIVKVGYKRKAMNSFVVRADRPIRFVGRMNEDVSTYALLGSRGELFLTVAQVYLSHTPTQQGAGGMSESYRASGTYVKSFYTVMQCPSFVQIRTMGYTDRRFHHYIDWRHAVPKILAPETRKD